MKNYTVKKIEEYTNLLQDIKLKFLPDPNYQVSVLKQIAPNYIDYELGIIKELKAEDTNIIKITYWTRIYD